MTQDEIIRMAREAGFEVVDGQLRLYFDGSKALLKPNYMGTIVDGLKEFATIVAAHEREKLAEQEPFDMHDHPPHRLCECRKCMEYFTPLPDCDAFAASGKQIAEQTNTQFMEGYRIGLAEMREKCAKVVTEHAPTCSPHWVSYVVAIRAIKFEGDTGFRPVSEMIAEHKQDPKKAAAIEKAKMRKAEQEPVAWALTSENGEVLDCISHTYKVTQPCTVDYDEPLYTHPVRTKDLTEQEIQDAIINISPTGTGYFLRIARAVIAADREKNKC